MVDREEEVATLARIISSSKVCFCLFCLSSKPLTVSHESAGRDVYNNHGDVIVGSPYPHHPAVKGVSQVYYTRLNSSKSNR